MSADNVWIFLFYLFLHIYWPFNEDNDKVNCIRFSQRAPRIPLDYLYWADSDFIVFVNALLILFLEIMVESLNAGCKWTGHHLYHKLLINKDTNVCIQTKLLSYIFLYKNGIGRIDHEMFILPTRVMLLYLDTHPDNWIFVLTLMSEISVLKK